MPPRSPPDSHPLPPVGAINWAGETAVGRKFMGSKFWYQNVLSPAWDTFAQLMADIRPQKPAVLDAGCGEGLAFKLIERHLDPHIIIGIEADKKLISRAIRRGTRVKTLTQVMQGDAALASFRDGTFDIILAHQILHHAIDPVAMLEKFAGLLKPGGLLLCAESCRAFVDSWPVKLLLRRPRGTQKTAQEYVQCMRAAGLIVDEHRVNTSRPWWTRRTLGLAQKIGIANHSEPTQVVLIARKPLYLDEGITPQENPAVTPRLSAD